jgi:hypothetical protein
MLTVLRHVRLTTRFADALRFINSRRSLVNQAETLQMATVLEASPYTDVPLTTRTLRSLMVALGRLAWQ